MFKVENYSSALEPVLEVSDNQLSNELPSNDSILKSTEPLEIIKWPFDGGDVDIDKEKLPVLINEGKDCVFFDEDVPRIVPCENEDLSEVSISEVGL
jgi:hypothetical protein